MPDNQQSGEDVREASVIRFLDAIMARSPNGEPVLVQYHPDGDWTVFDDAARHSALSTVNVDALREAVEQAVTHLSLVIGPKLCGESTETDDVKAYPLTTFGRLRAARKFATEIEASAALSTKAPLSMEGLEG